MQPSAEAAEAASENPQLILQERRRRSGVSRFGPR
jgi:hypothetical protein